ncbi:hypothetical protein TrLO_g11193 [Triparma laevis f. longispina]|uniref:Uncharacterized protein n=1 Tax=Triparma laevis f. longispina TaxID=1714387 RepID=A0A9W7FEC9_9STRA|nr:hypothetical protein TrLO_g11193 [Triparma laevis f. longispina]
MVNTNLSPGSSRHWDPREDPSTYGEISSSFNCFQEMVNMQIEITSKNMTMEMDGDGVFAKLNLSFIAKIQWNSFRPTNSILHKNDTDWQPKDSNAFNKYHFPHIPEIKSVNGVMPSYSSPPILKEIPIDRREVNLVDRDCVTKYSALKALKYLSIAYLKKGSEKKSVEEPGFEHFIDEVKNMKLEVDRYQLTQKFKFDIPTDFNTNLSDYPYDQHELKLNFTMSNSKLQAYDFDKYGVGETVYLKWKGNIPTSTSISPQDSIPDLRKTVAKEKFFEITEKIVKDKDGKVVTSIKVKHSNSSFKDTKGKILECKKGEVALFDLKKDSDWEVKTAYEQNPENREYNDLVPNCSQFQLLLNDLIYESELQCLSEAGESGKNEPLKQVGEKRGGDTTAAQQATLASVAKQQEKKTPSSDKKRGSLHTQARETSKVKPNIGCFKRLEAMESRNVYYRCIPKSYYSQAYNEVNENIAEFDIAPFTLKIKEFMERRLPKAKRDGMEVGHEVVSPLSGIGGDQVLPSGQGDSTKMKKGHVENKIQKEINRKQEKYYENSFVLSFTLVRLVHNGVFSILFPLWVMLTLEPFVYLFDTEAVNEPYAYLITLLLAITGHRQVMQVKLESFTRTTTADWLFLVTVGSILAQMAIIGLYLNGGYYQSTFLHWALSDDMTRRRTAFFIHEGFILIGITKSSLSIFKPLRLLRRPTKVSAILHGTKSNDDALEEIVMFDCDDNLFGVTFKKYRELIGVKQFILLDHSASNDSSYALFSMKETFESRIEVKSFLSYNLKMTLNNKIPTDLFRIRCGDKNKGEFQKVFSGSNDMVKELKDLKIRNETSNESDVEEENTLSRAVYGVMFHSQPKAIMLEMQFVKEVKDGSRQNVDKIMSDLKDSNVEFRFEGFYERTLSDDNIDKTNRNIKKFQNKVFRWWVISTAYNFLLALLALLRLVTFMGSMRSLFRVFKSVYNDFKDWRRIQREILKRKMRQRGESQARGHG